ncbi:mannosyl-N-acetyl-alpha-D-glucosaminyl-diphospho-ditrans,octacis-undecaprenol 3-alpha-mannosyltransferase / alpha-1,3-rhamnosyltransferase [Thermoflexales bacterium]|nr:mannosyl-N-acetyl-alpha-D-glucosaminyl-diphospho-ditrans,octacis-undecaprenol 3-alpha-mannosyltransferase / alpha-1,3-rhamnosyltransferase [Thermoflexales bacterium]
MTHLILDARTATDHFPGIGRYVVNLASALKRIAPDLDLALLRDPAAAQRLPLPDLHALDCTVSPFALAQQWRVRSILRQSRAALYHSAYYLMPYMPGVPAVVTCYDLIPLIYPQYFTALQRLIFRTTHFLALRASRVILAISEATKTDLVRFFRVDPQRIVVTSLAADSHFKPSSRTAIDRVRQQYALPDRYVLYFGSNKPHKNVPRLIETFTRLEIRDRGSGMGLVIAGHWDERYPQAKDLVGQLSLKDRVRFIGPVQDDDLPALYSGAEVFVFPSEYEGFGLPVLEAMACGAPVVCSNRSSLPEVAGDAALLCNPQNSEALTDAIERALIDRDLRATLQQRGLARAAQFSWEQTARQTLAIYKQCGH